MTLLARWLIFAHADPDAANRVDRAFLARKAEGLIEELDACAGLPDARARRAEVIECWYAELGCERRQEMDAVLAERTTVGA